MGTNSNAAKRRPLIVPVFLPQQGCPHQCVFCNQTTITGVQPRHSLEKELRWQVQRFLNLQKRPPQRIQIALFGGNFLGLPRDDIIALLTRAADILKPYPDSGIRFSTRPDTITRERLALIHKFPVQTVEIGVQSMHDRVLACSNRGHSADDAIKAASLLKQHPYEMGVQMMTGLPGDSPPQTIESAQRIAALKPAFVRIYPTLVLKNSPLARQYQNGRYTPPSLEQSVGLVKQIWRLFNHHDIPVIRMGLQVSETLIRQGEILAGPFHPAFGHLVYESMFYDQAAGMIQTALADSLEAQTRLVVKVHPGDVSKLRGLNNRNILRLKKKLNLPHLKVKPDKGVERNCVGVEFDCN